MRTILHLISSFWNSLHRPACNSTNVQTSTQNGTTICTCLDCGWEWEK